MIVKNKYKRNKRKKKYIEQVNKRKQNNKICWVLIKYRNEFIVDTGYSVSLNVVVWKVEKRFKY